MLTIDELGRWPKTGLLLAGRLSEIRFEAACWRSEFVGFRAWKALGAMSGEGAFAWNGGWLSLRGSETGEIGDCAVVGRFLDSDGLGIDEAISGVLQANCESSCDSRGLEYGFSGLSFSTSMIL